MARWILAVALTSALMGSGQTQLKDPPSSFTRSSNNNCLVYTHAFRCIADGACLPPERVRDGVRDCLDGSDEDAGQVNICDYAPYFTDYRCSVYADCLSQADANGYACRCKRGYVGPGENCQPAPLNMPRFWTPVMPLVIETSWNQTNHTTPTLRDLSKQVLRESSSHTGKSQNGVGGRDNVVVGRRGVPESNAMDGLIMDTREWRSDSMPTTTDRVIGSEGFRISNADTIMCPPGTIMVNESGQVWCLRLNGGRLRTAINGGTVTNSRTLPSFRRETDVVASSQNVGNAVKQSTANATVMSAGEFSPNNSHQLLGGRKNSVSGLDDYLTTQSNQSGSFGGPDSGRSGSGPGGAAYGYMAASANSRLPGYVVPLAVGNSPFVQGAIISPIKIWNETGGAITAYRVLPNSTFLLSCVSTQTIFLCADQTTCVSPDKILDGREDCPDGSDEVPEFIDECALGFFWPQYRCGTHVTCTDAMQGYSCDCWNGYFWNGSTCAASNYSTFENMTLAAQPSQQVINISGPASSVSIRIGAAAPAVSASAMPKSVSIISHPGFGAWTSDTGTTGVFSKVQQQVPITVFRKPPVLCTDCLSPETLTLGPGDVVEEAHLSNNGKAGTRDLLTYNSPRMTTYNPIYDTFNNIRSDPGGNSSVILHTPDSITGDSGPSGPLPPRSNNSASATGSGGSVDSGYVGPDGSSYPRFTTLKPATDGGMNFVTNNEWPDALAALAGVQRPAVAYTTTTAISPTGSVTNGHGGAGDNIMVSGAKPISRDPSGVTSFSSNNKYGSGSSGSTGTLTITNGLANRPSPLGGTPTSVILSATPPSSVTDSYIWTLPTGGLAALIDGRTTQSSISSGTNVQLIQSVPENATFAVQTVSTLNPTNGNIVQKEGQLLASGRSDGNFSRLSVGIPPANTDNAPGSGGVSRLDGSNGGISTASSVVAGGLAGGSQTTNAEQSSTSAIKNSAFDSGWASAPYTVANNVALITPSSAATPVTILVPFSGTDRVGSTSSSVTASERTRTVSPAGYSSTQIQPDPLRDLAAYTALTNSASLPLDTSPASAVIVPYMNPPGSSAATSPVSTGKTTGDQQQAPAESTISSSSPLILPAVISNVPTVSKSSGAPSENGFPTSILWSVPSGRQQRTDLQDPSSSQPPSGANVSSLEQTYDCFRGLFGTAYSALKANSRSCDQGCSGQFETCVAPGRCECRSGWARSGPNRECLVAFQYNLGITMTQLCGKPLIFQPYMSDLSNPASQRLAVVVCYQLEQLIRQSSLADRYSAGSCRPNSFSPGSVVSNLALSISSVNATDRLTLPYRLADAITSVLSNNNGSFDAGKVMQVKPEIQKDSNGADVVTNTFRVYISDIRECDLNISTCSANAICNNNFGSYSCACKAGFDDLNSMVPGRLCALANGTLNGTSCPPEYYRNLPLINPCLHPAYYILLIIAFVIAAIIILLLIGSLIACCCRCCNQRSVALEAPQVALIRAAARSPLPSTNEPSSGSNVHYQALRSGDKGDRLNPNAAPPPPNPGPYSSLSNDMDVEKRASQSGSSNLRDVDKMDVQTWEEVEVPKYTAKFEDDQLSRRALSPSQGSTRSLRAKLNGSVFNSEKLEETVTQTEVQRTQPHELKVPHIQSDGVSIGTIGSSSDIQRTEYVLPPSPSPSVKGITSAIHLSRKFHLQAQEHIRKASAETREWQVPRTESLVGEDDGVDGLDIDTLPHTDYAKDPVYELSSPIPATDMSFDEKDLILKRLGVGNRDSFDDIMDQTKRFYQESSSDVEYEKEGDLPVAAASEVLSVKKDGDQGDDDEEDENGKGGSGGVQRQPAFPMTARSDTVPLDETPDQPVSRRMDSQDDDDHQSLKSTDEDELLGLRGSAASLKSPKLDREISRDSVVDEMVRDRDVFYVQNNDSDEEEYLQRKSSLPSPRVKDHMHMSLPMESERKTSAIQRDIAINEFDALGERDSIDDFLDHTKPFFSRASTIESFQLLNKTDSAEEIGGLKSRKSSQNNMLTVETNGAEDPSPRGQRRPLLKKRSAFHSRDSMNKIMETEGRSSSEQTNDQLQQSPEVNTEPHDGEQQGSVIQETDAKKSDPRALALDDDDINDFFNTGSTSVVRRDSETGMPKVNNGDLLDDSVPSETATKGGDGAEKSSSRRNSDQSTSSGINVEIMHESVTSYDPDLPNKGSAQDETPVRRESDRNRDTIQKSEPVIERIEELQRPPSRDDTPDTMAQHTIRVTPPGDDESRSEEHNDSPREFDALQKNRLVRAGSSQQKSGDDTKSAKSVSDQNLHVGELDSSGQTIIPHDSDSGVYVETVHAGNGSSAGRQANVISSQDDLRVFEGQEERRVTSGSSYQRLSQSDDEEEIIKRYSTEFGKKIRKTRRIRQNYEMGPPESRHVYYTTRPKKMPPNRDESVIWQDSTWWRVRK